MNFEEAFMKTAIALGVKLPPKLPIKSLIPGSSKPSMPPPSHGFSIPPLSSSAPGATLPPQATIPAPRAA